LGKWVAKQREQYKLKLKGQHSFLTPYREEQLNQIGFSWHVRNSLDNEVQTVLDGLNSSPTTKTTAPDGENAPSESKTPLEKVDDDTGIDTTEGETESGTEIHQDVKVETTEDETMKDTV
jgi:uncharacterized membrane protein YgaE (UPF0421/DUF939 family)